MTDHMSRVQRAALMSRIRGKDTQPELVVRRLLHSLGFRFRLHASGLPGRPDIVLRKHGAIIFVNGCFWHHHACSRGFSPAKNRKYWQLKLARNAERDEENRWVLENAGWRVLVVWECETMPRLLLLLESHLKAWITGDED